MVGDILIVIPIVIIILIIIAMKSHAERTNTKMQWAVIIFGSIPIIVFFGILFLIYSYGMSDNKTPYDSYPSIYDKYQYKQ